MAVPILLPLFTAALMLLLGEQRRRTKSFLSVVSGLIGLLAALALLRWVNAADTGGGAGLDRRLPARQLARALRYRAGRRPALRGHGDVHGRSRALRAAVRSRAGIGPGRASTRSSSSS